MQKVIDYSFQHPGPSPSMPNLVTDYIREDGEDTEFVMPEMEGEEQEADSITYQDSHRRTMERLRALWPEKFKIEDDHWLSEAHLNYNYFIELI